MKVTATSLPGVLLVEPTVHRDPRGFFLETFREELYRRNLMKVALGTFKDFTNFFHGEWLKTNGKDTAANASKAYDLAVRALLTPWRGFDLKECYELRYRRRFVEKSRENSGLTAEAGPVGRDDRVVTDMLGGAVSERVRRATAVRSRASSPGLSRSRV